jgi:hypothetical protein
MKKAGGAFCNLEERFSSIFML